MTLLKIDLSDVAGGTHPDDNVVVWSPVHREGSAGRTVSPTQHTIRLTEGKGEREVEPGPLMVQTKVRAIADTRPKEVVVPDQATVTLWDLLSKYFDYDPPAITKVARLSEQVEGWTRDAEEAKSGAETSAQTAVTSASSAKTSETNAATSERNADASETNAAKSADQSAEGAAIAVATSQQLVGILSARDEAVTAASAAKSDADRAQDGASRVGTAEQVGQWADQAESAAGRAEAGAARVGTAEQVGQWADQAKTAKTGAQGHELAAKSYSESAQKIQDDLPQSVTTELNNKLPQQLHIRLPPLISTALAENLTIETAAAQAVQTAAQSQIGDLTLRLDATVGDRVFAGDRMIFGDTGWRDVTDTVVAPVTVDTGGSVLLRRIGNEVYWQLRGIRIETTTGDKNMVPIPVGFRHPADLQQLHSGETDQQPADFKINASVWFLRYRDSSAGMISDVNYSINLEYLTDTEWPSALPGTPA